MQRSARGEELKKASRKSVKKRSKEELEEQEEQQEEVRVAHWEEDNWVNWGRKPVASC